MIKNKIKHLYQLIIKKGFNDRLSILQAVESHE